MTSPHTGNGGKQWDLHEQLITSTVPEHLDLHISGLCIAAGPSEDLSSGAQLTKSLVRFHDPKISAYWRCFRLHDLPSELLMHIFRIFTWSTTDPIAQTRRVMLLTWVCRYWRHTLISSATMWSVILFKHPPPYEQAFTWLERAGTSPLYIGIEERYSSKCVATDDTDTDAEKKFNGEQIAWLMDKLFEKLPQIRHLVIIVERRCSTAMALDKLALIRHSQEKLCLERLEIHRTGYPQSWHRQFESEPHRKPRQLLGGAKVPSLKHVVLNAVHVDWVNSPLSNLTHLDIRDIVTDLSPDERGFRELLCNCPNLVSLTLDGFGPRWTMMDTVFVPVKLSQLRVLAIKNLPSEYSLFVLAHFTAPHIRKLTLAGMDHQDNTSFIVALTSSCRELRMLELRNFDFSTRIEDRPAIIQWLESMSDLEYLLADGLQPHFLDALFRYQVSDDPARPVVFYRQPLCPNLHTLEYYNMQPEVVLNFAVLRQERFVGLSRLYVGGLGFSPDTELKRCQVLSAPPVGEEEAEILRS